MEERVMVPEKQATVRLARPEDAGEIAKVHVDSWRESYAELLPANLLERLSYERRARVWRQVLADPSSDTNLFVLDLEGEGIKGFVSVGPERGQVQGYDGELYAIYLLKEVQGQGYGRRLFEQGVEALRQRGFQSMALWVLQDNAARGFYEHLGGVRVGEKTESFGDRQFIELAYGWPIKR
jgi:GNAT superfamily N-acetyltransferase